MREAFLAPVLVAKHRYRRVIGAINHAMFDARAKARREGLQIALIARGRHGEMLVGRGEVRAHCRRVRRPSAPGQHNAAPGRDRERLPVLAQLHLAHPAILRR